MKGNGDDIVALKKLLSHNWNNLKHMVDVALTSFLTAFVVSHCSTEVDFSSFFSGGFITA